MIARMCLIAALLTSSGAAAELAPEHRIPNAEPGVCMWACLESVGRQQRIEALYGLRDDVLITGLGRDGGAPGYMIAYWAGRRGFTAQRIAPQDHAGLRYRTERGQLVIATCKHWFGHEDRELSSHAVVVLHVTPEPVADTDGHGRTYIDHWVTYYDPNHPTDMTVPWKPFAAKYVEGHVLEPLNVSPQMLDTAVNEWLAAGGTHGNLQPLRRLPTETIMPMPVRRGLEEGLSPSHGRSLGSTSP